MGIKRYVGDSVYAELAPHELVLTVENGYGPTEIVILEWEVWRDLLLIVTDYEQQLKKQREQDNGNTITDENI